MTTMIAVRTKLEIMNYLCNDSYIGKIFVDSHRIKANLTVKML